MKTLITGATGYVGDAITSHLVELGHNIVRTGKRKNADGNSSYIPKEMLAGTDWSDILKDVTHVVHTAARVHVLKETSNHPLESYREVNVDGTLNLARQASQAGIKRFIFISTIGVNGSKTSISPFTENDAPHPHNDYAMSKWEAEQGLNIIAAETDMEIVIIRAPLVYGNNAPGNFGRLVKLVKLGVPLPFGCVNNKRSLIGLDNLVDFVSLTLTHPSAVNETFLVSDNVSVSTPEILRAIAQPFQRNLFLIPFPVFLLTALVGLLGKKNIAESLFCSLVIDNSKARKMLGWSPEKTINQQLNKSAKINSGA